MIRLKENSQKTDRKGTGIMKENRYELNKQLAQMLKGGVIMDVTTPEQAKIAEEAGACAVMALERIPADIRAAGGAYPDDAQPTEIDELRASDVTPQEKRTWKVEDFKNGAALRIVVACLAVMTVSAFVEHFCPALSGNDPLADLFDAFKLIATTALGFLFGRNSK